MTLFDDKFDPPRFGGPTREDVTTVAALEWDVEPRSCTPLVGGFRSTVFRAACPGSLDAAGDIVLRAVERPIRSVEIETQVMRAAGEVVPVPRPLAVTPSDHFAVIAMEFVDGSPIDRVIGEMSSNDLRQIGGASADLLVAMREVEFEESGFFGTGLQIERRFEHMGRGFLAHMRSCFDSRALRRRLDEEERSMLRRFLDEHAEEYAQIHGSWLTHSDFNLKNILVRQTGQGWELAALIDWEFAFSGHPLVDVGNMLRFEQELPPPFVGGFVERLTAGLDLEPDWRWRARLLDLTSIVQFLTRPGRFPQTTRTARRVLRNTIVKA